MSSSSALQPVNQTSGSVMSQPAVATTTTGSDAAIETIRKKLLAEDVSKLPTADLESLRKIGSQVHELELPLEQIPSQNFKLFSKVFPELRSLSIPGATIEGVFEVPEMPHLEAINISSTHLTSLRQFKTLKSVNVSNCDDFTPSAVLILFVQNQGLEKVNLSFNRLVRLPCSLPKLQELDCSNCFNLRGNCLDKLSESPNLVSLFLENTPIQTLPAKLPVQTLNLANCTHLERSFVVSLKAYPNLIDLTIEHTYMPLLEHSKLQHLTLTEDVYSPSDTAFLKMNERFPRLTSITLRFGGITEEQQQALQKQLAPISVTFE